MFPFLSLSLFHWLATLPEEDLSPPHAEFAKELGNVLFTLGLMLLFILIFAWVIKKFLKSRVHVGNTTNAIKILDRRVLGPKAAVYLLKVKNRCVLVAESSSGLSRLTELDIEDNDELLDPEPPQQKSFKEIFMRKK